MGKTKMEGYKEWSVTHRGQVRNPRAFLVIISEKPLTCSHDTVGGQVSTLHILAPGLKGASNYNFPSNAISILKPVVTELLNSNGPTMKILTDKGSKSSLLGYLQKAAPGKRIDTTLIKEENLENACTADTYKDMAERLLMVPPSRYPVVMQLDRKPTQFYRVAAIGLEGAGKSTTMKNLAEHASVKNPFDVGHRGGVSHTQRLVTARVGRFELIDTKGLPSYDTKYVEHIRRFFRGYAKPGEEIVWESLVSNWFWDSPPQYPPMDAMVFVVRYSTKSQAILEIQNFFSALRRFRSAVVAITHIPSLGVEGEKEAAKFAQDIGAGQHFVALPMIKGGVCPHALTTMMEKVVDVIEIERQIEGKA